MRFNKIWVVVGAVAGLIFGYSITKKKDKKSTEEYDEFKDVQNTLSKAVDGVMDDYYHQRKVKFVAYMSPDEVFKWDTYNNGNYIRFNKRDLWLCMSAFKQLYGDSYLDVAKDAITVIVKERNFDADDSAEKAGFDCVEDYLLALTILETIVYMKDRKWYLEAVKNYSSKD